MNKKKIKKNLTKPKPLIFSFIEEIGKDEIKWKEFNKLLKKSNELRDENYINKLYINFLGIDKELNLYSNFFPNKEILESFYIYEQIRQFKSYANLEIDKKSIKIVKNFKNFCQNMMLYGFSEIKNETKIEIIDDDDDKEDEKNIGEIENLLPKFSGNSCYNDSLLIIFRLIMNKNIKESLFVNFDLYKKRLNQFFDFKNSVFIEQTEFLCYDKKKLPDIEAHKKFFENFYPKLIEDINSNAKERGYCLQSAKTYFLEGFVKNEIPENCLLTLNSYIDNKELQNLRNLQKNEKEDLTTNKKKKIVTNKINFNPYLSINDWLILVLKTLLFYSCIVITYDTNDMINFELVRLINQFSLQTIQDYSKPINFMEEIPEKIFPLLNYYFITFERVQGQVLNHIIPLSTYHKKSFLKLQDPNNEKYIQNLFLGKNNNEIKNYLEKLSITKFYLKSFIVDIGKHYVAFFKYFKNWFFYDDNNEKRVKKIDNTLIKKVLQDDYQKNIKIIFKKYNISNSLNSFISVLYYEIDDRNKVNINESLKLFNIFNKLYF